MKRNTVDTPSKLPSNKRTLKLLYFAWLCMRQESVTYLGKFFLIAGFLAMALQSGYAVQGGRIDVHSGQTVPLFGVYWIRDCVSRLKKVDRIDVLAEQEYITLSMNQPAIVRTHQCNNDVVGAWLYVTAKPVPAETTVKLEFSVKYDTVDGPKSDLQTIFVKILP